MAQLTSVYGSFRANVLAARLIDEGFDVELRGASAANSYALTVGDLSRVDVFVPDDQMDEARYLMLVNDVEAALDDPEPSRRSPWIRGVAAAALMALTLPAIRVLGGFFYHAFS